jgi:hypothetical protein
VLRFCIPRVRKRGYGLGNELVPWARAFIAAELLDARLLPPAFGLNRRGYWRHFHTLPDDWIYQRVMQKVLPVVEFKENDFVAHGGVDAVSALTRFIEARGLKGRSGFAFVTEGLWGGYAHIAPARDFVHSTLYRSRFAARNLLRLHQRLDPGRIRVGMHVRLGDFVAPTALDAYRRTANASLPIDWYCNVAEQLQRSFADDWQLLLVSDGTQEQLQPLLRRYPCVITADIPDGDCSDALALAGADLIVCSASSYSSLAAFLSESPYIWFADNLHEHAEGCYSIHGTQSNSASQQQRIAQALDYFHSLPELSRARGIAVGADGEIPQPVLEWAALRRDQRRWQLDLVRGGVSPMTVPPGSRLRALGN